MTNNQLIDRAIYAIERYTKALTGFPDRLGVAMDLELARIALAALTATQPLSDAERAELQERRKAAMDSEPVVYASEETLAYAAHGELLLRVLSQPAGDAIIPLYRRVQQPVVPPEQHWEELCREYPDMSIGDAIIRAAWWNHCRAAMLAAAPQSAGSEPATVPGKWIPVSERMPETDGNYWGWWSESKRQGPAWFIKSELQAQFQSSEITHWMPLPAAPQEPKP